MIKKLWSSISTIGIKPEYDEKQVKRFTLINQYLVIAILIFFINAISDFFYGYYDEATLLLVSAVIFILTVFFKKHHHRVFITAIFIYISLTVFYFGSMASVQAGDYLYYFPLVLAISFAFDFKTDRPIMIFLFCFITASLLVYVFTYRTSEEINMVGKTVRYQMFVINLFVSAATVGFFIYLTIVDNRLANLLFEKRLKEKEESEILVKKTLAEKEILLAELHHRVKK